MHLYRVNKVEGKGLIRSIDPFISNKGHSLGERVMADQVLAQPRQSIYHVSGLQSWRMVIFGVVLTGPQILVAIAVNIIHVVQCRILWAPNVGL